MVLLQNKSISEVSRLLYISKKSVRRYLLLFQRTTDVRALMQRHGPRRILRNFDEFMVVQLALRKPSVYVRELAEELQRQSGREVSQATVWRTLRRFGFSHKKLNRIASQRDEERRDVFRLETIEAGIYTPDMFVFLDEAGFDLRNCQRRYGYSLQGTPASEVTALRRGRRISAIAAMSINGVLDVNLCTHGVDGETFLMFLRKTLLPHLMPFNGINSHSIVVMDNASIHHIPEVSELLRGVGVLLKFLPAYSPDMNPIEEVFSKVKYYVRQHDSCIGNEASLREQILNGFIHVSSEDCTQYVAHSGYMSL